MEIYITETGEVTDMQSFRTRLMAAEEARGNVLNLPYPLPLEMLLSYGAQPIMEGAQPVAGRFQSVVREGVEVNKFGAFKKYVLRNWSQEEIAQATEQQWQAIKRERDTKLADTDWYIIRSLETGIPLPEGLTEYRQALRDITLQPDPFSIVWPPASNF